MNLSTSRIQNLILETRIKCPHCQVEQRSTMTSMGRKMAHDCRFCNQTMYAKPGKCCVFCSYGSIKCPASQEKEYALERAKVYS